GSAAPRPPAPRRTPRTPRRAGRGSPTTPRSPGRGPGPSAHGRRGGRRSRRVPVLDVVPVGLGDAVAGGPATGQPGADRVAVGTEHRGSGVVAAGGLGLAVRTGVEEPQR